MSNKSVQAWTAIAVGALLAHFSSGAWPMLLVLALLGYCIMERIPENVAQLRESRMFCAIQLIGVYLLISQLVPLSAQYWPGEKAEIVIPAVLILLGIVGCGRKPERVAGVLFHSMVLLLIPLVLAGGKDIELGWIRPKELNISVWVSSVLLFPVLVEIATGVKPTGKWYLGTAIAATGIWIIVYGILSAEVAVNLETPFRNMTQSLSLGPYSRFESIGSIVITLGWYGFVSLALYCADQFWKATGIDPQKTKWIHIILLLTILLFDVRIAPAITVAYTAFAWIFFPFFELKKRSKKSEKST